MTRNTDIQQTEPHSAVNVPRTTEERISHEYCIAWGMLVASFLTVGFVGLGYYVFVHVLNKGRDSSGGHICDELLASGIDMTSCSTLIQTTCGTDDEATFTSTSGACNVRANTNKIVKGTGVSVAVLLSGYKNIFHTHMFTRCVPPSLYNQSDGCCVGLDDRPSYCSYSPNGFHRDGRTLGVGLNLCVCHDLVDCGGDEFPCDFVDVGMVLHQGQCLLNTSYAFAGRLAPTPCVLLNDSFEVN